MPAPTLDDDGGFEPTDGRWAGLWPENGDLVIYDTRRSAARVRSDGAVSLATA